MRYKCFPLCAKLAVLPPAEKDKIVQCTTECTPSTTSLVRECFCLLAQKGICASLKVLQYVPGGDGVGWGGLIGFMLSSSAGKIQEIIFFPAYFIIIIIKLRFELQ